MSNTNKKVAKELYISVDVEADGTHPGQTAYSMVSLGAVVAGSKDSGRNIVRADLDSPDNQFMVEIKPISDKWNPEALAISGFSREHFMENGVDPVIAMTSFAAWVDKVKADHGATGVVFTAFPLGFDWMWTYWYLCEFSETGSPFGHSRHVDIKSTYSVKADELIIRSIKRNMAKSLRSSRPHTHNPLDDAIEQGELFMNILEWEGRQN